MVLNLFPFLSICHTLSTFFLQQCLCFGCSDEIYSDYRFKDVCLASVGFGETVSMSSLSNGRTSRSLKPELSQCPTSALTLQYWANGDSPSADRYSFYVAFILTFRSATWIICLPRVLAAAAVSSCQGRHSFLDRPWHSFFPLLISIRNFCMLCCESIGYTHSVVDVWTDRWSGGPCGWWSSYAESRADVFFLDGPLLLKADLQI